MQFSHRQPRERRLMDLSEALGETYQLISKSFDRKIEIQADIPDSLPVVGDYAGLSQVFFNLCTNARDAMPGGGNLMIRAKQDKFWASITISDTGHGMDPETIDSCFDPFFTTKTVDKGTGLGLSTTYGIVKDHQGEIQVHSEPGKGTVFTVRLPMADAEPSEPEVEPALILNGTGEKILIVDDEVEMIKSMAELLKSVGYRTATAGSGKAALDICQTWRPDVVLLDRNMPGVDGISYAESIVDQDPAVRIVLISGYEEYGPDGIDERVRAVTKAYMTKPIDFAELSHMLRDMLEPE
jgi:CheY-like chemotaxis protein